MKRFILFVCLVLAAVPAFAQSIRSLEMSREGFASRVLTISNTDSSVVAFLRNNSPYRVGWLGIYPWDENATITWHTWESTRYSGSAAAFQESLYVPYGQWSHWSAMVDTIVVKLSDRAGTSARFTLTTLPYASGYAE